MLKEKLIQELRVNPTGLVWGYALAAGETTPILPDGPGGHRDTLVLTFRAGGFQEPQRA